jgi:hypothetical protein
MMGTNLWYSVIAQVPNLYRADTVTIVVTASYYINGGLGALTDGARRYVIWADMGGPAIGNIIKIYNLMEQRSPRVRQPHLRLHQTGWILMMG